MSDLTHPYDPSEPAYVQPGLGGNPGGLGAGPGGLAGGPVRPVVEPPPAPVPDPAKAEGCMHDAMAHLIVLVESIIASVPSLHGLVPRAQAMRRCHDAFLFHTSPVSEPPPPPRDDARVAVLEAKANRTPAEDEELARLTGGPTA